MKVSNMMSSKGNLVPNQFIIRDGSTTYFQSYRTIIAKIDAGHVTLDKDTWDYSRTTAKYRNLFLGRNTSECKVKIKSGEFKLENLNN
jgi:hypothetical protein